MSNENQNSKTDTLSSQGGVSKSFASGVNVIIVGNNARHEFGIGEMVTLVEKEKSGLWKAYNKSKGNWWIDEEDANVC